ncbi:MAG: hypothetical protein OXU69_11540 [Gemmatimonadota bacterium]|nr:hypothetical protein [Gemmatimonadota bacterium]MDE2985327.1 hypothetical protein [Gemmatimonadota bacterium]
MIISQAGRRTGCSTLRLVFAAVIATATSAPGLQGQEGIANTQAEDPFHVMAGARVEFFGLLSPGASIQVLWDTPGRRASWLGAQLHAQLIRFEVDPQVPDAHILRRDLHFTGRVKAGFGRGDGPIFYGFAEAGVGMITAEEIRQGDTYLLSGVGAGVGITLLPVTFAIEGTLGRADRPSIDLADSFVMTLLYHFR